MINSSSNTKELSTEKHLPSQENFAEADEVVHDTLKNNPDNVHSLHLLAHTLLKQNQAESALHALKKAQQLEPTNTALLLDTAHIYQAMGRIADAAECYRLCSEINPADGYARELHSQGLLEQWIFSLEKRKIGREASKSYAPKVYSGFMRTYLSGAHILDIGYRGGFGEAVPIVAQAIGIDLGYPGYDGVNLPFADESQDAIYTSHCLEHMSSLPEVIREWFRVLKVGGYAVVVVPHQYLYERKHELPSKHPSHLHFFTPAKLLATFESALKPNHYRVRHLLDNDLFYDYSLPPTTHPVGCYEIELVLEKIKPPKWDLE
jgi:SAM-dependent methyltransferase